jgi:hypothetical protein
MPENDLTDEELAQFEELTKVKEDLWDRLELLRRKLNESHLEKMYVIKRSSNLGPLCPYYRKALRLFLEQQRQEIEAAIFSINHDLTENRLSTNE